MTTIQVVYSGIEEHNSSGSNVTSSLLNITNDDANIAFMDTKITTDLALFLLIN